MFIGETVQYSTGEIPIGTVDSIKAPVLAGLG